MSKITSKELSQTKKIVMIFLSLFLLFLTWQSLKMGKANLNFYAAHQIVESWMENRVLTDPAQYQRALTSINDSNESHPANSHYLLTQGRIYEWGGTSKIFTDENEKKQHLLNAKKYYLEAVKLRPTWPGTWATLAILKWRLGEIDQQFVDFLLQADKFGQHIPEVNQAWLEIGFYLYQSENKLSVQIIKGLKKHLNIMFNDLRPGSKKLAMDIIKRHNAQKYACSWLNNNENFVGNYKSKICKVAN